MSLAPVGIHYQRPLNAVLKVVRKARMDVAAMAATEDEGTPNPTPPEETPGDKPESTEDAEGGAGCSTVGDPTSDDGYKEKAESTEEYEGPTED